MPRNTKPTSTDYDYEVEQRPLFSLSSSGERIKTSVVGNFRTDNDVMIGHATESYEILHNKDLVDSVREGLEACGIDNYEESFVVARDGARFYGEFKLPNLEREVSVGDVVSMKLITNNSFDRTCSAGFSVGLERQVCSNGMVTLTADTSVAQKHSSRLSLKFIQKAIEQAKSKFDQSVKDFGNLRSFKLTPEEGSNFLDNLAGKKILSEKVKEHVDVIWRNPSLNEGFEIGGGFNLYNLYNAATQHLTRDVAESRYEYSNRVSGSLLRNLDKASRSQTNFQKMVKPLEAALN